MAAVVFSQRGHQKLHHNGYRYCKDRQSADGNNIFWRCEKKLTCRARCTTDLDLNISKLQSEHSHEPDDGDDSKSRKRSEKSSQSSMCTTEEEDFDDDDIILDEPKPRVVLYDRKPRNVDNTDITNAEIEKKKESKVVNDEFTDENDPNIDSWDTFMKEMKDDDPSEMTEEEFLESRIAYQHYKVLNPKGNRNYDLTLSEIPEGEDTCEEETEDDLQGYDGYSNKARARDRDYAPTRHYQRQKASLALEEKLRLAAQQPSNAYNRSKKGKLPPIRLDPPAGRSDEYGELFETPKMFSVSSRGNRKLFHRGYFYCKDKMSACGNYIYWRCEKRNSCRGRATTDLDYRILRLHTKHTHSTEEVDYQEMSPAYSLTAKAPGNSHKKQSPKNDNGFVSLAQRERNLKRKIEEEKETKKRETLLQKRNRVIASGTIANGTKRYVIYNSDQPASKKKKDEPAEDDSFLMSIIKDCMPDDETQVKEEVIDDDSDTFEDDNEADVKDELEDQCDDIVNRCLNLAGVKTTKASKYQPNETKPEDDGLRRSKRSSKSALSFLLKAEVEGYDFQDAYNDDEYEDEDCQDQEAGGSGSSLYSERGHQKLQYRGYIYCKDKASTNGESIYWRCERRAICKARATSTKDLVVTRQQGKHTHPSTERPPTMSKLKKSHKTGGQKKLFHKGYFYYKDKVNPNGKNVYWRCDKKLTCSARATTDINYKSVSITKEHNHPPSDECPSTSKKHDKKGGRPKKH